MEGNQSSWLISSKYASLHTVGSGHLTKETRVNVHYRNTFYKHLYKIRVFDIYEYHDHRAEQGQPTLWLLFILWFTSWASGDSQWDERQGEIYAAKRVQLPVTCLNIKGQNLSTLTTQSRCREYHLHHLYLHSAASNSFATTSVPSYRHWVK